MSERDDAIRLANKVLDTLNRDPDDDLSMMSRQFLRAIEARSRPEPTEERQMTGIDTLGVNVRPPDIPQDVWDEANSVAHACGCSLHIGAQETIATAIMAASERARGREAEALRFYARGKHFHGDIITDRGEVARAALAGSVVSQAGGVADDEEDEWQHETPFITSNSGPDGNKFISVKVRTHEALNDAHDLIIRAFKAAGAK